jgi:NAD(P)-dependent dehydrogenase (short-subunit alcohol dehydrogenase family)
MAGGSLEDKVVLVTGGSRGIGESIARAAAEAGASVVLAARKREGLEAVCESIRSAGGTALPVACHTGKADEVDALLSRAVAELGKVDVLINNAATNPHFGPLVDATDSMIDKIFEVNVKGYFYACRAFVRHLRERGAAGGSIVNVASVAGMRAAPLQGFYGMSKAAILSMTRTLAYELGGSGIRVNAIAPGLVDTRFSAAIVGNESLSKLMVERTPLRRYAQPDEIAAAAVYLASDAASFASGAVFVLDGGLTAV